jgi:hypothetical protein
VRLNSSSRSISPSVERDTPTADRWQAIRRSSKRPGRWARQADNLHGSAVCRSRMTHSLPLPDSAAFGGIGARRHFSFSWLQAAADQTALERVLDATLRRGERWFPSRGDGRRISPSGAKRTTKTSEHCDARTRLAALAIGGPIHRSPRHQAAKTGMCLSKDGAFAIEGLLACDWMLADLKCLSEFFSFRQPW